MPIFPYDDEEERRRRRLPPPTVAPPPLPPRVLPDMPTPTQRPLPAPRLPMGVVSSGMPGMAAPSPLPETVTPNRVPMPAGAGIPGGMGMPRTPSIGPAPMKTRPHQIEDARQEHLGKTPGRLKSGLLNALKGGLAGLASGGGLGAALGGAVGGGAFGAITPRGAQDMDFEQRVKPKILDRFRYEDQDTAARMAGAKAAGEQAMTQAQLENINSQIQSRSAGDELSRAKDQREANRPMILSQGQAGFDPKSQRKVFEVPAAPKAPTQAELGIEPTSGKSYEEISEESYQGRGGDAYVLSKMSPRDQQLIQKGTVTINGVEQGAEPSEIAQAQRAYENAIERQRKADVDYTRGSVRSGALGARRNGGAKPAQRKGQPGRNFISVSEGDELLK